MNRVWCALLLSVTVFSGAAESQAPDFLHPQQKGPFQVNGLSYVELAVTGNQSGYADPLNLTGYSVPTLDQMVTEIKATGTNLVKLTFSSGQVKNYTDNTYDPTLPFPMDGKPSDIVAFGRKLTSQGIGCVVQPFAGVENIIAGATVDTSRVNPTDPRAFMMQHIPRLVTLAQFAESMGCEYFIVFGDEIEFVAANPAVTDLWIQAIAQVRSVFSGRVICESAGGFIFDYQPRMINMLDIFGTGLGIPYTDHADATVAELVGAYQKNVQGLNFLKAVASMHTLYQKPVVVADQAYGSFKGSNSSTDQVLFGEYPASQFTLDYQEQVNLYQAFFQAMPALDPNWMLGAVFDSIDRLPYAWKDGACQRL
jgi:hypothetical protein